MTNLDSILKSRDVTLSTKVRLVKAMVFPMVIYGYGPYMELDYKESLAPKKIDIFELWSFRRLLRVPWTSRMATSPS